MLEGERGRPRHRGKAHPRVLGRARNNGRCCNHGRFLADVMDYMWSTKVRFQSRVGMGSVISSYVCVGCMGVPTRIETGLRQPVYSSGDVSTKNILFVFADRSTHLRRNSELKKNKGATDHAWSADGVAHGRPHTLFVGHPRKIVCTIAKTFCRGSPQRLGISGYRILRFKGPVSVSCCTVVSTE